MACHVLWLEAASECGACGHDVPAGYRLITDEFTSPAFVVVCEDCTSGLEGVQVALHLLAARKRAGVDSRGRDCLSG